MRKHLLTLTILSLFTASIGFAQEPAAAKGKPGDTAKAAAGKPAPAANPAPAAKISARNQPAPNPAPVPAPEPTPKKKGFFGRVFGGKEKATPAPVATPVPATPTPVRRRPVAKREVEEQPAPNPETAPGGADAKPETKPAAPETKPEGAAPKTVEAEQPAATPGKRGRKKPATPAPVVKEETKEQRAVTAAVASGDPEAIEKAKYDEARARAVEDPHIIELRKKADTTSDEEEGRKALRAYNRALFQKMRSLQPDISDRVERMEAAVMKRLDGIQGSTQ